MNKLLQQKNLTMDNIMSVVVFVYLFFFPILPTTQSFGITQYTGYMYQIILASSVVLVWGYCGIYSFAQAAFFGLSGYCYAVIALNLPSPELMWVAAIGAVVFGFLVAALIGYFIFYGGVNDSFIGVMTLCFTILCQTYFMQTADTSTYRIGKAAFNGYNGITSIPGLLVGGEKMTPTLLYYVVLICLCAIIVALILIKTRGLGYSMVAIRENPSRASLLGYNNAKIKMLTYAVGGAIAGLAGVFYIWWGGYIVPTSMSMTSATIPIVIVAAGGRKSPISAVVFGFLYLMFASYLSYIGSEFSLVILGAVLLLVILVVPNGVIETIFQQVDKRVIAPLLKRNAAPKEV